MFVTNKHNDVVINSKYETQSLRGEPLNSARLTPLTLAGNNKQATVPPQIIRLSLSTSKKQASTRVNYYTVQL